MLALFSPLSLQMAGPLPAPLLSLLHCFSRGRVLIAPGLLEEIPTRLESVGLKPAALVPELVRCKNSFKRNWLERGDCLVICIVGEKFFSPGELGEVW